jgi:hypothetical protein
MPGTEHSDPVEYLSTDRVHGLASRSKENTNGESC